MDEGKEDLFPPVYREYTKGEAQVNKTLVHQFNKERLIQYEERLLKITNLGDEANPQNILVEEDWNLVLKVATFRIFLEYKDVFAWT